MQHNIEQVRRFLKVLVGDDQEPVTWQIFFDPKDRKPVAGLARHFVGTLDDNLALFEQAQRDLCGIYIGINETDGIGRKNENITEFRACFADFDGMIEPHWLLSPHLVQKRDETHGHALWLIEGVNDVEEWVLLQKRIAIYYSTDHQVHDPARVIRISGFNHYKDPANPAQYSITHEDNETPYYTANDIIEMTPLDATQEAELNQWLKRRESIDSGTGYTDEPRYIEQTVNWLKNTAPVAVKGQGRSGMMIRVASYGHDYGISCERMKDLMWEHYNHRVVPPYQPHERTYKHDTYVERGYYYAHSAAGCKTAVAGFSNAVPALVEPVGGWEENAKLKEPELPTISFEQAQESSLQDGRVDKVTASAFLPQLNVKSSHFDLAVAFDGVTYDGENLIRCQGICYEFNGVCWSEITDDMIKTKVLRFYQMFKPNDTFVKGVTNMLFTLINVENVQNGTWLNDDKRDPSKILVFKNGLVDISGKYETWTLEPHDRNYFTFNSLSYNFNKKAQCPKFHEFVNSVWEDDETKLQLRDMLAYLMTLDNSLQVMFILLGKSRAGKGVLVRLIGKLIGEHNTCAPSLSKIHSDHTLHKMSTSSAAFIPDAHDVPYNSRNTVLSTVKAITGNDPVTFDVKFKPAQTTTLKTRLILSTNNMPEFNDASGALANRMVVFLFLKSFVGREDTTLDAKLSAEVEGVAQWALSGLDALHERGKIFQAKSGLEEKQEIKEDMFPLARFVNDICVLDEHSLTLNSDLYNAYRFWCTSNGVKSPMTEIAFSKCLSNSDLPIVKDRNKKGRGFRGIYLNSTDAINNVVGFPKVE